MFKFKYLDSMITLLVGFIIMTILVIIAAIYLKDKSEKTKLLPIKIIFFVLVIMEVAKIYYCISKDGVFNPNRFPIVFCSIILYTYPLFCFKENKFSDLAKGLSVIPCLIAIILVFLTVGDNPLVRENGTFSIIHLHSIFYHLCMYGVALYLISSKLYKFEFKKGLEVGYALISYIAFATILGLLIKGDISYFGYGFNGSPVFKIIYDKVGYLPGNLIISLVFMGASILIYYLIDVINKYKNNKKLTQKENN